MINELSSVGSVALGGGMGLLGGIVQLGMGIFKKRQQNHHRQKMADKANELMRIEGQQKTEQVALATDSASHIASMKHDKATYSKGDKSNSQMWLMTVVDFIRGTTRPFVTYYLLGMQYAAMTVPQGVQQTALEAAASQNISFMASTAVSWWFSSRTAEKIMKSAK